MKAEQLFRLAGAAAVAAGLARIGVAFPILPDPIAAQWAYTAIDVLLLFALMGIYLRRAESLGFLGLASFGVGIAALSFIGGPDADPFGFSTYEQGAAALAIAMAGLSIAWVRANQRPLAPPLLWFASLVAAGALAALPAPWPAHGFTLAGVLFAAGFVAAGLDLWRSQSKGAGS